MMRSRIPVAVGLVLVVAALLVPASTWAQGRGGRGSGNGSSGIGSSGGRSGGWAGRPGFNGGHGHHGGFNHRRFNSNVVFFGPSPFWYSAPLYASPPVVYSPPPVYIAPQFVYQAPLAGGYYPAAAPAPPPGPRVVEFSTGRYELRGDGMSTPYTWVWIPNPPSAPPGPPPAPTAPPPGSDAPAARPAPTRTGPIYRWTDDNGVTTITDDLNKVPERYRVDLVKRTHL
jgi:hypothetical protein